MADHSENNKPMPSSSEAVNTPAQVGDGGDKNLDFSVSSNVREVIGSLPAEQSKGGATGARQQLVTKTPQERKAELLARLPKDQERAERYMKRQVESTLESQLGELEHELNKTKDPYTMNVTMAKIRHFRDILSELFHVTYEQLKSLWLQFVHNLSV